LQKPDLCGTINIVLKIRRLSMAVSYNKLWKLLIDKKMKKKDLQKTSGISSSSVAKLGRNENVNTEILQKICNALHCDISDIMEMENGNNI
jgi:DNA-binding Xre family transcriptional regulator